MFKNITILTIAALLVLPAYGTKDEQFYQQLYNDKNGELNHAKTDLNKVINKLNDRRLAGKDINPIYAQELEQQQKIVKLCKERNRAWLRWQRNAFEEETLTDRLVDLKDDVQQAIKKHNRISAGVAMTVVVTTMAGLGYYAYNRKKVVKPSAQ